MNNPFNLVQMQQQKPTPGLLQQQLLQNPQIPQSHVNGPLSNQQHPIPNHQLTMAHFQNNQLQQRQINQMQAMNFQYGRPPQHIIAPPPRPAPRIFKKEWSNDYKLFVGNLPPGADQQNVLDLFGAYGELSEDSIVHTKKRLGFIKFRHKYQAERAILELSNLNYAGHKLQVHYANHNASLKISNLAEWVSVDHLIKAFRRFGELEKVHLCYDPETKKSRGYGYVYFARHTDALACYKECSNNMLVLTVSPRPVVVKMKVSDLHSLPLNHPLEDDDGEPLPLKHRREILGEPHFPTVNSLEYAYCKNWRDTLKRHEEEFEELKKKHHKELEKLKIECRSYVKMVMKQEEKQREEVEKKLREQQQATIPTQQPFGIPQNMSAIMSPQIANMMSPQMTPHSLAVAPQAGGIGNLYNPHAAAFMAQQRQLQAASMNLNNPAFLQQAHAQQQAMQQTIPSPVMHPSNLQNAPMEMSPSPPVLLNSAAQMTGAATVVQPLVQPVPLVLPPQQQKTQEIKVEAEVPVPQKSEKNAEIAMDPPSEIKNQDSPPDPPPEIPSPAPKGPPTPLVLNSTESIVSQLFGGARPNSPRSTNEGENPNAEEFEEPPDSPLKVGPSPFDNVEAFVSNSSAPISAKNSSSIAQHPEATEAAANDRLPKKRKFEEVNEAS